MRKIRARLRYSNVVSTICLFLILGGGAYAAFRLPKNSVGTRQLKPNAVNASKVRNGSLHEVDFAPGQLPRGATGPQGPTGTVDTTNFYDKAASDQRFLGKTATAADSAALGGVLANDYAQAKGGHAFVSAEAPLSDSEVAKTMPGHWTITFACPLATSQPGTLVFSNESNDAVNLFTDDGSGNPNHVLLPGKASTATLPTNPSGDAYEFDVQGWSDGMIAHIRVLTLNRATDCHFQIWATWMTAT